MDTSSAISGRRAGTIVVARVATGIVLACFGFWELTDPTQWTGYVPHVAAAAVSPVRLVLVHGWVLFVLAAAALVDFAGAVTSWIAVAVMAEVVVGLLATSGFVDILVRDVGLLALALVWALETQSERQRSPAPSDGSARTRGRGRTAVP
jgi:hypothetical protein